MICTDVGADAFARHGDVVTPGCTYIHGATIEFIVWVLCDHYTAAFHRHAGLNENTHVGVFVVDKVTFAGLVRLKIPYRRPYGLHCFDDLFLFLNILDTTVKSGTAEVSSVFGV